MELINYPAVLLVPTPSISPHTPLTVQYIYIYIYIYIYRDNEEEDGQSHRIWVRILWVLLIKITYLHIRIKREKYTTE